MIPGNELHGRPGTGERRQRDTKIDGQTERQTDSEREREVEREGVRRIEMQKGTETDREIER